MSWGFVGSVFNQGSTFAVNLLIANLLGRAIFGEYSVVQSTAVNTLQLAQLATGYTATKYLAEYRNANPERAGRILSVCGVIALAMSVLAALGLAGCSSVLATHVLRVPTLTGALRWSAAIVLFGVNGGFLTGAMIGLEEYRSLGICSVIAGTIYTIACTIGARSAGFQGALAGLTISYLAQTLVLALSLHRALHKHHIHVAARNLKSEFDVILRFTVPAALSGLSALPALWLATAALVRTPNGLDAVAIYAAAFNLRIAAMFLPHVVNNVGLAILNNERGQGTQSSYRRAFWTNWLSVVGFAVLVSGSLAVLAPYALRLFGRSFADGLRVAWILLGAAVIEATNLATSQILQNRERLWLNVVTYALPRDITLVTLAFIWAPRFGAVGVAFAFMTAQLVSALLVAIAVTRLGIHPHGVNAKEKA